MVGSIKPEMCTKMLRNDGAVNERLRATGYSMVRIARLSDAFSGILDLDASPEAQSRTKC